MTDPRKPPTAEIGVRRSQLGTTGVGGREQATQSENGEQGIVPTLGGCDHWVKSSDESHLSPRNDGWIEQHEGHRRP